MKRAAPVFAIALVALVVFAAPAQAMLPEYVWVFGTNTYSPNSTQVSTSALPQVTRDYDILLRNRTEPSRISLTGVPIVELLKLQGTLDVDKVPFVKIRFGDRVADSSVMLIALTGVADGTPPPMIMSSGAKPGIGKWHTPSVVPGQPGAQPVYEQQIRPFDAKHEEIAIVPAKEGAKIISVSMSKKLKSNGEYLLTADVKSPTSHPLTFTWYTEAGPVNGKRYATKNVRTSARIHTINVVVTEEITGSTGVASFTYLGRKADDGATKDPGYGKKKRKRRRSADRRRTDR